MRLEPGQQLAHYTSLHEWDMSIGELRGDPDFQHADEGPDDMSAHVRTVLTQSGLNIPVQHGRCALGTWQGIYLWEHRTGQFRRKLTVTVHGEA